MKTKREVKMTCTTEVMVDFNRIQQMETEVIAFSRLLPELRNKWEDTKDKKWRELILMLFRIVLVIAIEVFFKKVFLTQNLIDWRYLIWGIMALLCVTGMYFLVLVFQILKSIIKQNPTEIQSIKDGISEIELSLSKRIKSLQRELYVDAIIAEFPSLNHKEIDLALRKSQEKKSVVETSKRSYMLFDELVRGKDEQEGRLIFAYDWSLDTLIKINYDAHITKIDVLYQGSNTHYGGKRSPIVLNIDGIPTKVLL